MEDESLQRVLLIDQDVPVARATKEYLEQHGLTVSWMERGDSGLAAAMQGQFDVVLCELQTPGVNGIGVCQALREQRDTPFIIITACAEEADRVLALESGADDYMVKPLSSRELLARIRSQIRRARGKSGPSERVLSLGELTINPGNRSVMLRGKTLELTSCEFTLLRALAERAGRVLTREQLLDLTHGSAEEAFDRSIDVRISRLRQKLGDDPRHPSILKTVRGVGYLFAAEGPLAMTG